MERYEVASFIREARAVSSDPQVEQQMLNSLLAHARGAADHFLDEYYHSDTSHNPFQIAQKQTVSVQIDSILQLSAKSYEVRWTEQAARSERRGDWCADPLGGGTGDGDRAAARGRDAIVSNPLGFYVDRISWTQQQG